MPSDFRQAVLDAVDAELPHLVDTLAGLVAVPSISGTEAENDLQHSLATMLTSDGLEVDHWEIDLPTLTADERFPGMEVPRSEAWGLVGKLPGSDPTAPSFMINAHLDVVPTGDPGAWAGYPFAAAVREGRLHGRGACDMKGGLAAALLAMRALTRSGIQLPGDVLLTPVQGEEDGGLGTFALLERGWRAGACVVPEPTDLNIVPANAGALTFRLTVPGSATHASRRTEGVSAIDKFVPVLAALARLETRRNLEVDPLMTRWEIAYPTCIGTVHAGDWASSVPDLLVAEGRLGVALGEDVADARASLEQAVAAVCAEDPWLSEHPVVVEWWGGQFASGRTDPTHPLLASVAAAHAGAGGSPQDTYGGPYGSDLRLLTGIGGIPTVQYGPGESALAHSTKESVPLEDVATVAKALALLAVDMTSHRG